MKPGSKEVNSPGPFKANEAAMMFKNNMPKQINKKSKRSGVRNVNLGYGRDNEKLGNKAYVGPGDTVNVSPDRIDFLVKKKGFRPPRDTHDSILLSNSAFNLKRAGKGYDNKMFKNMKKMHNTGQFHKDFPSTVSAYNKLKTNLVSEKSDRLGRKRNVPFSKRSGKPNMYGKPKMYGKKK